VAVTAGAETVGAATVAPGRPPRVRDFVRLKLRLMRNGFRGQAWRVVLFVIGVLFGFWFGLLAFIGLGASGTGAPDVGFVVASLAGSAVVLGWTFFPLLFFGVDETLDPARFALLPVPPLTLARGMLAAAFCGIPAVATLFATAGLTVAAAIRFGLLEFGVAAVGVVAGLTLGVIASRAITSAFAALLRSRKVRDLAAVIIAVLASSIGPLQWLIISASDRGSLDQAVAVARVLAWTPLGAPYVVAFDAADGQWLALAARLAMTFASIGLLLFWWSRTLEPAMLGAAGSSGGRVKPAGADRSGAVASLIPRMLRGLARPTAFGAIVARESRFWWRDPRRRASLVSIVMASAVLPIILQFASRGGGQGPGLSDGASALVFSFAITIAGTMGGMLLANQFAFDGTAYAAHLMQKVPGRTELRARALALAVVVVPAEILVVIAVSLIAGTPELVPGGLGMLATGFGAAAASASVLSVLAAYALPENTNPFALNSGGGSAKGMLAFVAMIGTLILSTPVTAVAYLLPGAGGAVVVGVLGVAYGGLLAFLGTLIAGDLLDRRGPELLVAITPRR